VNSTDADEPIDGEVMLLLIDGADGIGFTKTNDDLGDSAASWPLIAVIVNL
jgi:hypothetical protein